MKIKIDYRNIAKMVRFNTSKFLIKVSLIAILLLASFHINAQIIFQETFSSPDGTTAGTANGVDWSSSCPACLNNDYWEVKSGVFEANDTNGEAVWKTDTPIDISNCGLLEISFDIESVGTMEACGTDCNSVDWVRFQYNIDGTGWVDPSNSYYCSGTCASINVIASDDVNLTTYSTGCIPTSGSSLQLRISVQCWASSEYWQIDNITVNCNSSNAGTNGVLSICSTSNPSNLFDQLGGNPVNGGTWTGPSNLTGGFLGIFNPTTMNAGTFTYTVGIGNCQESSNVTVTIENNNNAGNDTTADLCSDGIPINLFNLLGGNPDNNGTWTGPSNLSGGDAGTFSPATMNPGTFTYTVGTAPCHYSSKVAVNIIPSGNAGENEIIYLCNNSPVLNLFDELGGNPDDNGIWTGSSSLSSGNLGTFNPASMSGGVYTYTVGISPCENSATISIEIDGPIANFTANPTVLTIENTEVEFTNESQNSTDYIWNFGDNSSNTNDVNPIHNFPDFKSGTYTVTLTAYDANNCSESHTASIVVIAPKIEYEIPNIFTPNEDGENDLFKLISSQNTKSLEIVIVNRWGNLVFESSKINFEWNGKVKNNGAYCTEGTYFFKIKLTDLDGKEIKENGFVQIAK